jgi:hypothetical protein
VAGDFLCAARFVIKPGTGCKPDELFNSLEEWFISSVEE